MHNQAGGTTTWDWPHLSAVAGDCFAPSSPCAPQKSLFIRNVRLLKGSGEARGEEEEKENRKGKMKGKPEQRVERCYRRSEILSEPWTSLRCELLAAWPETIPICLWLEERHPKRDKVTEQLHKAYTCFLCTLRSRMLQVWAIGNVQPHETG